MTVNYWKLYDPRWPHQRSKQWNWPIFATRMRRPQWPKANTPKRNFNITAFPVCKEKELIPACKASTLRDSVWWRLQWQKHYVNYTTRLQRRQTIIHKRHGSATDFKLSQILYNTLSRFNNAWGVVLIHLCRWQILQNYFNEPSGSAELSAMECRGDNFLDSINKAPASYHLPLRWRL